ncbi:patatin-like phospholipase [Janthinobacterium sp. HH01]|uniref:patatin-like phospholipase family protein n=1 Tax=Janthinobacterium sp. HH01 TaxID=1198452 RepID=UPI0002AEDAC9|nr:patatin-like phospholipase family protein [Janthinobacterium sp. HH01]ELX10740.1 patatin-like phospholipase [Janthinobacterium sp. HH01]
MQHSIKKKTGLVLGGGAPNSPLIAGALAAFLDQEVEFDVISASGAGVLMGLLYAAPLDATPREALKRWADTGVSDTIYKMMPVNYKIFHKPGQEADVFRNAFAPAASHPVFGAMQNVFGKGQLPWTDWSQLLMSTMSPSNLSAKSLGLCAHAPFLEGVVDFSAIASMKPEFYINAYNLNQHRMKIWDKHEIQAEHVRAALSFPFLYAPTEIDGEDYIEGAALETLNFDPFIEGKGEHHDTDTLIVLDILGDERLLRKPRNLYDAWVGSMITPLVKISQNQIRLFELEHNTDRKTGLPKRRLLKLELMAAVPDDHMPNTMDWSTSNMQFLFDIGYKAATRFCRQHSTVLRYAEETELAG